MLFQKGQEQDEEIHSLHFYTVLLKKLVSVVRQEIKGINIKTESFFIPR